MSKLEEAIKLCIKGKKLGAEGDKLWVCRGYPDRIKSCSEIAQLYTESDKLWAEGYRLWDEELIRLFGFIPDFMSDIRKYVEP